MIVPRELLLQMMEVGMINDKETPELVTRALESLLQAGDLLEKLVPITSGASADLETIILDDLLLDKAEAFVREWRRGARANSSS